MRVLLNLTASQPGTSGEVFAVEWMHAAAQLPSRHTFVAALTQANHMLAGRFPPSVQTVVLPLQASGALRTVALQRVLPQVIRDQGIDVLLNRGNFYNRRPGCRQICLVENANAMSHPAIAWPMSARE